MQIRWDEASISIKGKAYRVAHKETGLLKIRDVQPLSTIPPKSYTKDGLIPTDNINYAGTSRLTGNPMIVTTEIFPNSDYGMKKKKQQIESLKGAVVMIYLPLYVAGKYSARSFQVNINDITPYKKVTSKSQSLKNKQKKSKK
jgi:hypothetical protein